MQGAMSISKTAVLALALSAAPALAMNNAPPDGWITTKAKLSLWTTANLKSSAVHVDCIEGVVTLYGAVNDPAQKELAERTVKDIRGVRSVHDLLQIVPEAQADEINRSDAEVKSEVTKVLKDDPALKDSKISVKAVNRGVVLLTGKAQTISDQLRAVTDVQRVAGVRRVAPQIEGPEMYTREERRVQQSAPPSTPFGGLRNSLSDTRITTEVKLNLLGASDVPWNNINVDTMDGVVTMFGTVPTDAAKAAATQNAERVPGVAKVKNELQVKAVNTPPVPAVSDNDITKELDQRFKGQPQYKHVGYSVKDGAVRLTGTIDTGWDRLNAVRLVRQIRGVKIVHDDLMMSGQAAEQPLRQY
jgi:osmotically-inducible protein OsmY